MCKFKQGDTIGKISGSEFVGIVLLVFRSLNGDQNIVAESTVCAGLQLIYRPSQLKNISPSRGVLPIPTEGPFKFAVGDDVLKKTGYFFEGKVVGCYNTLANKHRYVVEMYGSNGLLHIYSPAGIQRHPKPLPNRGHAL